LTNDDVLQVDQDPLGQGARQVSETDSILVYEKDLADGSKAIGVFNTGSKAAGTNLSFSALGLSGTQELRDLWRQKVLGTFTGEYAVKSIPSHGVLLIRASKANP
jgi:alpha-galactosidase